jgi:hypothetical protein
VFCVLRAALLLLVRAGEAMRRLVQWFIVA